MDRLKNVSKHPVLNDSQQKSPFEQCSKTLVGWDGILPSLMRIMKNRNYKDPCQTNGDFSFCWWVLFLGEYSMESIRFSCFFGGSFGLHKLEVWLFGDTTKAHRAAASSTGSASGWKSFKLRPKGPKSMFVSGGRWHVSPQLAYI